MINVRRKYHYVYALIDPRTAAPFYIGKGSGARLVRHFQTVPRAFLGDEGSAKFNRVAEIKAAGLKPTAVVLSNHDGAQDALDAEVAMIKEIGLSKLTNKSVGGEGDHSNKPNTRPRKLSLKEEAFCLLMSRGDGITQTDAYVTVYDTKATRKTQHEAAARMMKKDKIAARIAELRQPSIDEAKIDLDWVINKLKEGIELGGDTGNAGAVIAGAREVGKISDLYPVERKHVELTDGNKITALIREGRARAAEETKKAAADKKKKAKKK